MSKPSGFVRAPPTLVQMSDSKSLGFMRNRLFPWILKVGFMGLALFATVTFEDKVEAPSSDLFCISDCATCPAICSPPPPLLTTTTSYPPPSPSVPHSPFPSYFTFSPPPPKSQSPPPPSSDSAPPPPFTPPSGSAQPQPTVISGPHDYYYPYYYFYNSGASSLSIHAPFLVLLLFLIGYSFVGNM